MPDQAFKIEINTQANTEGAIAIKKALSSLLGVLKQSQSKEEDSTKAIKNLSLALEDASKASDEFISSLEKAGGATKETTQETQKLKDELVSTGSVAQGVGVGIGIAITNAFAKIPSLIKSSLSEYGEKQASEVRLQAALVQTGQAYGDNLDKLKSLADQMEILTNADGKQILSSMSVASAMGVSAEQMEEVTKGAIGIATAFQMDLSTATKASAAAFQGKTELLSRYIPTLSECATEEEKLAMVQRASANGLAQAQAQAETFSGRMTALGHSVGALSEALGEIFVPAVETSIENLNTFARYLSENTDTLKSIVRWVGNFAAALATVKLGQYISNLGLASTATKALGEHSKKSAASLTMMAKATNLAKGAMYGLATSVKVFFRATLVLGLVSLAFEVLWWAIDKVRLALANTDKAQKKHQEELDKTAKKNQELAKAEIDRLKNTTLSEDEYAVKKSNNLKAIADAQNKLKDAFVEDLDSSSIQKEIARYKELAQALEENIEKTRRLARQRDAEASRAIFDEAVLQKKKLIADLDFESLDAQAKLNILLEKEERLTSKIASEKEINRYYTEELQVESAKSLENSIKERASIQGQIQSLKSAIKVEDDRLSLEKEREAQAKSQLSAELAILKAKSQGNEVEVARLERTLSLETLKRQYKAQGIKSDKEAISLAEKKLALEEDIAKAQLAQSQAKAKEEFLAEYKIIKARADGDETLARTLELQKEATSLANKLGIEYNEALNALKNLEKAEEARNNKNKDTKVSYDEKDVQRAKKVLEKGVGGSIGQKSIDQAQAIVDGKAIEGKEYAMFSGASKRAKAINEGEYQMNNQAYDKAQNIAPNTSPRGNIAHTQNEALSQQEAGNLQNNNITPSKTLAKGENSAPMAQSKEDTNASDKSASLLAKEIKEVVKKLNETNKILEGNQDLLEDIKNSSNAGYI